MTFVLGIGPGTRKDIDMSGFLLLHLRLLGQDGKRPGLGVGRQPAHMRHYFFGPAGEFLGRADTTARRGF